jgi:hypothetical protein
MRVELLRAATGEIVLDVCLSETNLLALLAKLHTPGSSCELRPGDIPPALALVRIRAEPDERHYDIPSRGPVLPGELHPITERVVEAIRVVLADYAADGGEQRAAGDPTDPRDGEDA